MISESFGYVTEQFVVPQGTTRQALVAYVYTPPCGLMSEANHVLTYRNNVAAATIICDMSEFFKTNGDMSVGWHITITYMRAN